MKRLVTLVALAVVSASNISFAPSAQAELPRDVRCNCVKYARLMVPRTPVPNWRDPLAPGLTSFEAKKSIINDSKPAKGSVAVIDSGSSFRSGNRTIITGHLAVVSAVDSKGNITINETNWGREGCNFSTRSGSASKLNIVGYFNPSK
jgi:hypothetical protein